jgi:hypothetical protein
LGDIKELNIKGIKALLEDISQMRELFHKRSTVLLKLYSYKKGFGEATK